MTISAYQKELYTIREFAETISCSYITSCKVKGHKLFICSGVYDGEFIAHAVIEAKMLKEEAMSNFRVTGSIQVGEYIYIYAKGIKSLKDIIRRTML
jgi:hypothetical protein